MNRCCGRLLVPLVRQELVGVAPQRNLFTRRSPWGLVDVSRQLEDVERTFSRMEREMNDAFRNFGVRSPFRTFFEPMSAFPNQFFPTIEAEKTGEHGGKYVLRMNLGSDFNPENIKVSLKDRLLTIDAKLEQKSEDGHSRIYQEISKSFTLPENVKIEEVKSLLTPDGVLTIEAPLPELESAKPKEIPIAIESK
jgi:HSP20 family molecular chaperone IbpA